MSKVTTLLVTFYGPPGAYPVDPGMHYFVAEMSYFNGSTMIQKSTGDVDLVICTRSDCIYLVTHDVLADRVRFYIKEYCVNTGVDT
jgi:hypothetical protein